MVNDDRSKKGFFFSIDALIAVMFILSFIILVSFFYIKPQDDSSQPIYFASDILQILSTSELSDFNTTEMNDFLNQTNVTETNRTVIEQVLRFQVQNQEDYAEDLLGITLNNLIPSYYTLGIFMEGYDDPIYKSSDLPITQLISSKQMVSGIEKDRAIEGLSSRAFLSGINQRSTSSYTYFGGYEGDGNITKTIILPDSIINMTSFYLELDAGSSFDLYINDISSGSYTSLDGGAESWYVNESYLPNLNEGSNEVMLAFSGEDKFVGGGYIKIDYSTSEIVDIQDDGNQIEYLPGIEGIVNVYTSFYSPGDINYMKVLLHYNSSYDLFMAIGNQTVLNETPSGDNTIIITDAELMSMLDYSAISNKTVPVRLGIATAPEGEGGQSGADIVLITDLSDSMNWRMNNDSTGTTRDCTDSDIYDSSSKRISVSKCLDKDFIDAILNNSQNKVALAGFYGDSSNPYKGRVYKEDLTNNADYLKERVDLYSPQGGTCICCAINTAYEIFDTQSSSLRKKYIVVMSDGIPTHTCQAASGCTGTRTGLPSKEGLWLGGACYGGADDCGAAGEDLDCQCAVTNANWSACRAYNQFNSTIYSIGFGPVAACYTANSTLMSIADCGQGEYFSSDNATILADFYRNISEDILSIGYDEQTAIPIGEFTETKLYPDSYIEINYTIPNSTYVYAVIPVIIETGKFNNNITTGSFEIPSNVVVYDAKAVSYSGERWTDKGQINNSVYQNYMFYNLSYFGDYYYSLGDPYLINIPINLVQPGTNLLTLSTGVSPTNSTGGSIDDKVIYTLGITLDVNYTGVFAEARGCTWYLEFEDNTNATIKVPSDYIGTDSCTYNQSTDCNTDYEEDAIDNSICHLFSQMDFDGDGKLLVKFGSSDIDIETFSIGNIPYMWGPSVLEVRVWK